VGGGNGESRDGEEGQKGEWGVEVGFHGL
jgi:hypothetical protein